jgi:hypothetical protein
MMTVLATRDGATYEFGSNANEFLDAKMIIMALTKGGYSTAFVKPGSRPERTAAPVTPEEREAMAAITQSVTRTMG